MNVIVARWFRFALTGISMICLWTGCASGPVEDASLDVRLVNLRFVQATVFETTVVADLRFENVAPGDIEITGAAHKIVANGRRLGRGLASTSMVVPRLGTAIQSVELRLGNLSVAKTMEELTRNPLVDYQVESTIYVKRSGDRERSTKLVRSGILDLSRLAVEGRR